MKLYITLLITSTHIWCTTNTQNPTDYVVQRLAQSTTLISGSQNWLPELSVPNAQVRTAFGKTRVGNYAGIAASLYAWSHAKVPWHLVEDSESGTFDMKNNNGTIEVTSNLSRTEVTRTSTSENAQKLTQNGLHDRPSPYHIEEDATTRCIHTHRVVFNEDKQRLETTRTSTCTSKFPLHQFFTAINAAYK